MHGAWGKAENETIAWLHVFQCAISFLVLRALKQQCLVWFCRPGPWGQAGKTHQARVAYCPCFMMTPIATGAWMQNFSLCLESLLIFLNEVNSRIFPMACFMWFEGEQEIRLAFPATYYRYTSNQAALNLPCEQDTFMFKSCTKEWGFLTKGSTEGGNFHSFVRAGILFTLVLADSELLQRWIFTLQQMWKKENITQNKLSCLHLSSSSQISFYCLGVV